MLIDGEACETGNGGKRQSAMYFPQLEARDTKPEHEIDHATINQHLPTGKGESTMSKTYTPAEVDGPSMVFGGNMAKLMPNRADIPEEFKRHRGTAWNEWAAEWFFSGLRRYPKPKDGIDVKAAMRHLASIQRSFEPKHEHKEAAVAFLASKWFDSPDGEPIGEKA